MENIRVLALVVTYNRLEMLKECLEALRMQSYKNFDILVVDNGSTDGTKEYLDKMDNIIVIHQDNLGGAGGFYTGEKYMYDHKEYDALWMMDDDGLADCKQLENLVLYSQKYHVDYSNALLLNRDERDKLFDKKKMYDKDYYDKIEFIPNKMYPFNGTLIYRYVIEKVGFIKKEMFIWGDEVEYRNRIKANGFTRGTIAKAIHYHPAFKNTAKYIIPYFKIGGIDFKPEKMAWVYYRNKGYNEATYGGNNWIRYVLYYLVRLNFSGLSTFLKYYLKGRKNDFSDVFRN